MLLSKVEGPRVEKGCEERVCEGEEAAVDVDDDWVGPCFEVWRKQNGRLNVVGGHALVSETVSYLDGSMMRRTTNVSSKIVKGSNIESAGH